MNRSGPRFLQRARMGALTLATLLGCVAFGASARAAESARLRVVTWNVWDVPGITSHLDERIAAVPDAVASLEPDIVLFQELWEEEHANAVTRRLAARGLVHHVRFESPEGRTGLVVASRFPLGGATFRPFAIGRLPHSLWHLDWLVSKGLASVSVETTLGALRVENTHLQAQYRTDHYGTERLAQATELVLSNREHANEPLVLGGDFNGDGAELPRRFLRDHGAFDDAYPAGEDSLYTRAGRGISVRVVSSGLRLDGPVALGNGVRAPLSDHAALLVELELSTCVDCAPPRRVTSATHAAAVASLERAADATPLRVALSLLTALLLALLAVTWQRRPGGFRSGPRGRVALRFLGVGLLATAFVWTSYLGTFYYPTRAKLLRQIVRELKADRAANVVAR